MTESQKQSEILTRGFFDDVDVRAVDADSRTATFVAATENGVETWNGREYLRMGGANFERYRKNPVVLDTHNRYETGAIVGRADITIKNRELIATITFAKTDRAEDVWELVRERFLKALSVGFIARDVQVLQEGESSGAGRSRIEGPARVVREWELYEISVVPVPADAEAIRRGFLDSYCERLQTQGAGSPRRSVVNDGTSCLPEKTMKDKNDTTDAKTRDGAPQDPPSGEQPQEMPARLSVQRSATEQELRARDIRAIAPRGLEAVADDCVIRGLSVEESRKRLLEEHAKRLDPVGTPEPVPVERTDKNRESDNKERLSPEERTHMKATIKRSLFSG